MDVAEELLDAVHALDRAYVERRLADWRLRLVQLYATVAAWLPPEWSMGDGGEVAIEEDLMRRFDVAPQRLPAKTLIRLGRSVGRMEPRGLWIIGSNGRVDIVLPGAHYLLNDRAESFEPPDWQVSTILQRRDQRRLTRDVVATIFA